jgi:transposase
MAMDYVSKIQDGENYTINQVAEMFNVSRHAVARWLYHGTARGARLGYTKIIGRVYISRDDLNDFIEACQEEAVAP